MAIVNNMDAGLPMWKDTGYDGRSQAQYADAIKAVNQTLLPYSSFRGWAWFANWWEYTDNAGIIRKDGKDLRFNTDQERQEYAAPRWCV